MVLSGSLETDPEAVGKAQNRKGFFIIATNEIRVEKLGAEQLLSVYRDQGVSVERGFRFLEDSLFYAESLYLKSPRRIMALIMVMGLSLLAYSFAEKKLRTALAENDLSMPNQVKKPTKTPTIRWVFQFFEDVIVLKVHDAGKSKLHITNFEEQHRGAVTCLGKHIEKMYFY